MLAYWCNFICTSMNSNNDRKKHAAHKVAKMRLNSAENSGLLNTPPATRNSKNDDKSL